MKLIPLGHEDIYTLALIHDFKVKDFCFHAWRAMINKNRIYGVIK